MDDTKSNWPRTRSAEGSVVLGLRTAAGNRNTRLLPGSVTQRLPWLSIARPARNAAFWAKDRVLLLGVWQLHSLGRLLLLPETLFCPMTRSTGNRSPVWLSGVG